MVSRTGTSEEEEAQDEDDEEDSDDRTATSGEEIYGPDKDAEQDDEISEGGEDFNQNAVQGGGSYEADEWEIGGIDRDENEELLEAEDSEKASEEEGSGKPDLPPKAAEFFAVSDNFDQHGSSGRYLHRDVVPV